MANIKLIIVKEIINYTKRLVKLRDNNIYTYDIGKLEEFSIDLK